MEEEEMEEEMEEMEEEEEEEMEEEEMEEEEEEGEGGGLARTVLVCDLHSCWEAAPWATLSLDLGGRVPGVLVTFQPCEAKSKKTKEAAEAAPSLIAHFPVFVMVEERGLQGLSPRAFFLSHLLGLRAQRGFSVSCVPCFGNCPHCRKFPHFSSAAHGGRAGPQRRLVAASCTAASIFPGGPTFAIL
jgi:hypothetical protein